MVVYVPPIVTTVEEIAAATVKGSDTVPVHKPVLTVFLARKGAPPMLSKGGRGRMPSYSFPETAARALGAAARYHFFRERPEGDVLVSDLDAAEMIDRLRLRPLFDGYRGGAPADRFALIAVLERLSALVEELPELRELDLNLVRVLRPGEGVIVVDARIRVGPQQ